MTRRAKAGIERERQIRANLEWVATCMRARARTERERQMRACGEWILTCLANAKRVHTQDEIDEAARVLGRKDLIPDRQPELRIDRRVAPYA